MPVLYPFTPTLATTCSAEPLTADALRPGDRSAGRRPPPPSSGRPTRDRRRPRPIRSRAPPPAARRCPAARKNRVHLLRVDVRGSFGNALGPRGSGRRCGEPRAGRRFSCARLDSGEGRVVNQPGSTSDSAHGRAKPEGGPAGPGAERGGPRRRLGSGSRRGGGPARASPPGAHRPRVRILPTQPAKDLRRCRPPAYREVCASHHM
jgi:hypothetical protein